MNMDFESLDVMKDFPGLYASEMSKKCTNDSDYSDEADKLTKKDILIGKRKDKKDKKDKERGYAALEGESSAEENYDSRSPSKSKKSKSFKFTSKSKEKREKSRDKEKELPLKLKEKDKKGDKKVEKEKNKSDKKERKLKQTVDEHSDIADGLPIFGVSLDVAIERSRCHDGVEIPLPIRACIDHVQSHGLSFEGVYKIGGTKSKVAHLRKMYNHRENVNFSEYDIPTATSLLKMFLRDLPEAVFTNDLLIRFEEAGAILNVVTREKHLKILIDNLPLFNKVLLSWLMTHFSNVVANEKYNKMNRQNLAAALCPSLRTSARLFTALLHHCKNLFPTTVLYTYIPPLTSTAQLPDELNSMEIELKKQESLLTQIHAEMNAGFISKQREELLWEVQRIITQLKRKLKIAHKEAVSEKTPEDKPKSTECTVSAEEEHVPSNVTKAEEVKEFNDCNGTTVAATSELPECDTENATAITVDEPDATAKTKVFEETIASSDKVGDCLSASETDILLLQYKNNELLKLKETLLKEIEDEKNETVLLKSQLHAEDVPLSICYKNSVNTLDEVMDLLHKENQILEIEKINLVRQIMEQQEICIDLRAKLAICGLSQVSK